MTTSKYTIYSKTDKSSKILKEVSFFSKKYKCEFSIVERIMSDRYTLLSVELGGRNSLVCSRKIHSWVIENI